MSKSAVLTERSSEKTISTANTISAEKITLTQLATERGYQLEVQLVQTVSEVIDLFEQNPSVPAVLVYDQDRFITGLSESRLKQFLSQRFGFNLFYEKPLSRMQDLFTDSMLEISGSTNLSESITQAISRSVANRYEPVVVRIADGRRFAVDLYDVLSAQCYALTKALDEIKLQRAAAYAADLDRDHMHQRLLAASRQAGMAEIASAVMHNIGNVLNTVTVSTHTLCERLEQSKLANMGRAMAMIEAHQNNLGEFFTEDDRGRQLPGYLTDLTQFLLNEQQAMMDEIGSIAKSIEHITHILQSQQAYANGTIARETFCLATMIQDLIKMNGATFKRHHIRILPDLPPIGPIRTDRHLVMQILVNLLTNAKQAILAASQTEGEIHVRLQADQAQQLPMVRITISDNGIGIAKKNITRIFAEGFTTRKDGTGIGLHTSANTAKQLGGYLSATSAGEGLGATFYLQLPASSEER